MAPNPSIERTSDLAPLGLHAAHFRTFPSRLDIDDNLRC
jgi:hypothetical protein